MFDLIDRLVDQYFFDRVNRVLEELYDFKLDLNEDSEQVP